MSQFEISICRAEILEAKWNDEDALKIVPRFWRGPKGLPHLPVAILGDYIVFWAGQFFSWASIHRLDELPLPALASPDERPQKMSYMDLMTSTLYLVSLRENLL